jgi:hypothetical protein
MPHLSLSPFLGKVKDRFQKLCSFLGDSSASSPGMLLLGLVVTTFHIYMSWEVELCGESRSSPGLALLFRFLGYNPR